LTARADSLVRTGTEGADRLVGTNGDDIIFGLGGNDRIIGRSGNDILGGGAGDDFIIGGNGNDRLIGGSGNNTLIGGGGNNTFVVGEGSDRVLGFNKRRDVLDLDGAFATAAEFKAATTRVRGSTVVRVPGGGSVSLPGIKPADLVVGTNVTL
ncbi:MAG TPA: hypothetical protein VK853_02545, partial [Ilumatobacteraceae bacterium]|nr:hypothetical protein [Ilumatobacteraceae bacterium]